MNSDSPTTSEPSNTAPGREREHAKSNPGDPDVRQPTDPTDHALAEIAGLKREIDQLKARVRYLERGRRFG